MADRLAATAELVDIASPSHHEAALADLVEARLRENPALEVVRIDDNVIARTTLGRATRVILAGHLDTVPAAGNATAVRDGDVVFGCGASDMKSGLAVLLELAGTTRRPRHDLTFVFYACEEVAREHSGLRAVDAVRPDLLAGDAAVLLEPTDAQVEAGCQGVLRLSLTVHGERAHSARPWTGVNAVHRLGPLLVALASFVERRPVLEGCEYHETLQAVGVEGGVGGNVIPDLSRLVISHRFAPDRSAEEAYATIAALVGPYLDPARGDGIEIVDVAPAAPPRLDTPILAALLRATGAPARAKVAWTDVAFFAEHGIPALNYGPGDPLLAHRRDESVRREPIDAVHAVLSGLLDEEP
jgi:succinyl-diaminopimelate desuccinylase